MANHQLMYGLVQCLSLHIAPLRREESCALLQALKDRAALHWGGKALRIAWTSWLEYMDKRRRAKAQAQRALQHWGMLGLARVPSRTACTWLCISLLCSAGCSKQKYVQTDSLMLLLQACAA